MSDRRTQDAIAHTVADDAGTSVTAYLLAGPLTFGGLGWLADRWFHTRLLVGVGVLIGLGLALYVIWLRYGGGHTPAIAGAAPTAGPIAHPDDAPRVAPAPRTTNEETT